MRTTTEGTRSPHRTARSGAVSVVAAIGCVVGVPACSDSQDSPPEGWSTSGPICEPQAAVPSGGSCYAGQGYCNPMLLSPTPANPNLFCNYILWQGHFECVGSAGDAPQCAACSPGNEVAPDCAPGLVCLPTGRCARICCTDADCGGAASSCTTVSSYQSYLSACVAPGAGG